MSKNDMSELKASLKKLIKADAKVTKPTETDASVDISSDPYKAGLSEVGKTYEDVMVVRNYDKTFTHANTESMSEIALDVFKEDKKINNVSSGVIHMAGNKLEISVDRTRTLKNPGTGESIVRHGYITVSATAGYASGKDMKTLRDLLMENSKTTLA